MTTIEVKVIKLNNYLLTNKLTTENKGTQIRVRNCRGQPGIHQRFKEIVLQHRRRAGNIDRVNPMTDMMKINANQYVNTNFNRANNKNDSGHTAKVKRTAQPTTTHATSPRYTYNYNTYDDDFWSPSGRSQYEPVPHTVRAVKIYVSPEKNRLRNALQTPSRPLSTSTVDQEGVSRVIARSQPESDATAKNQPDSSATGLDRSWIYESRTENKPRRDRTQLQTETHDTSCCRCTIL